MPRNFSNNYDKYGFALKSVKKSFREEWQKPYIEIKYITNNKNKNINPYGYAFKDFIYSISTKNSKELVNELYKNIKSMDIVESTKYLLTNYPTNAKDIIKDIPSYVLIKPDFYQYLSNYIKEFPKEEITELKHTINYKISGIDKFMQELENKNSEVL